MNNASWTLVLLLAACGGGGSGGKDAVVTDPGTPPADPGVVDPGAVDPGTPDPGIPDVPATDPGLSDLGLTDPGPDTGCPPVPCDLDCPFGLLSDDQGCPYCACAACANDADCHKSMTCDHPSCNKGFCACDCAADEGISEYECPDGTQVLRCACSVLGVRCIDHPEYLCPTLCAPGDRADLPCPGGPKVACKECKVPDCHPVCGADGWVDSCTGKLLKKADCKKCQAVCSAIGTKSEGWYDSCGGLIGWDLCGPRFLDTVAPSCECAKNTCEMGQSALFECPSGKESVPWCECAQPDGLCPPVCDKAGTADEGWYDACSKVLIKKEQCEGCNVKCDLVGSKSEGWYSSCTGLIAWANCGTGLWECKGSPWELCTKPSSCVPENGQMNLTGDWHACCPGLESIPAAVHAGDGCDLPGCDCRICTFCGDGVCKAPENPCNCPADCPVDPAPKPALEPCVSGLECGKGFECAGILEAYGRGVCSRECDPVAEKPNVCADVPGSVCAVVPYTGATRYCVESCFKDADCPVPLTCRVGDANLPGAGFCLGWNLPCQPFDNLYCAPGGQCRIAGGKPVCGAPGTLKQGDACKKGDGDLCGPGLVCGAIDRCWPVCQSDHWCQDAWGLDFCLGGSLDAWGHCMFLE